MSANPTPLLIDYTNYRGIRGVREIIPIKVEFKATSQHPIAQWIMTAFDYERRAIREFAMMDIHSFDPENPQSTRLIDIVESQKEWSEVTFGPSKRTLGVVAHIEKELAEIKAAPDDVSEWIDVTILALDGAWRSGATPYQVVAALKEKQAKNQARTWPDWRTQSEDSAIEHDRSKD